MYAEIQAQTNKHSLAELCFIYGVSRSGYYKWLKRSKTPNRYEQTQRELDHLVSDIHAHNPKIGYRQIRDTLELQFGLKLCDPTVWRSVKRLDIHGYTRKRKLSTTYGGMEHVRYSKILRAGNPYDNAVMESFWGRFKDALRVHFRYWERDDLRAVVAEAVHYFNFIRPVRKLNGEPPVLFRTELAA